MRGGLQDKRYCDAVLLTSVDVLGMPPEVWGHGRADHVQDDGSIQ